MNRVLVITYSYTGTSLRLAKNLCDQQGWALGEIEELAQRRGFPGILRCLVDSLLRRQPQIEYVGPALRKFDTVVLVAPVWANRLSSPMRSFVALFATRLPDIAAISVMGGSGAPAAMAEIAALARRPLLLSAAFTTREVKDGSCSSRLQGFAQALLEAKATLPGPRTWPAMP